MYIAPNTTIKILKNVPLDPTYDHTIYFSPDSSGNTAQYNYFITKAKYTLTENTYQRVNKGKIRVGIEADNLYDCNYIMFQNTNFGSKWFYAFIKSVEYINNAVSEIEFEIDVMQTWNSEYTLDKCYVEREHSASDELFSNIVVENVDLGNDYVSNSKVTFDMNQMDLCILHDREASSDGSILNNVYIPIRITSGITVSQANLSAIEAVIDNIAANKIIAIYQYPTNMRNNIDFETPIHYQPIQANTTSLNGYMPKNKKLYTYPYNFLLVSNNSGQTAEYKWENFDPSVTPIFKITGTFCTTPVVICFPNHYRGIVDNYDEGITLSNFPVCAWGDDMFKSWWAENKNSYVTAGITSVVSAIGNGVMSGVIAGGVSANPAIGVASAVVSTGLSVASTVANNIAKVEDIKATPNQTHGQVQTDCLNAKLGRVQFDFYSMSIKAEYAKIIDEYFDRYGYATKRNKVPNRNVRPHWTYTKTIGCTITGSIPCDDATAICEIYNNGITFWKYGSEVGNYNLDNTI